MRLMRMLAMLVASSCLILTPAFAGQRGRHGDRPTGTEHAAPEHPEKAEHPEKPDAHRAPLHVSQKIASNPALAARLQPLLPAGTTLDAAAAGFKNEGQFIAALHVAHNLNIPFTQLKAELTGSDHDSLGQAIHDLSPTANAKSAARTAERQARADLKATRRPVKADTDKDKDDR